MSTEAARTEPHAAAREYAARGWRVMPLHSLSVAGDGVLACSCNNPACRGPKTSAGKHPRIKSWQVNASADVEQVDQWWSRWPLANVGVALGTGSGIVSIDLDSVAGEAVVLGLAGNEGLPATLEMVTSAGKRRLLFAIPDSLEFEPATASVPDPAGGEAVRFQSTGAQCVMPPSLHNTGTRYTWAPGRSPADMDAAPMPGWLIARMAPAPAEDVKPTAIQNAAPAPNVKQNAIPGEVPEIVSVFNRDADWLADVLAPKGWKLAGQRGAVIDVTRPGKPGGVSATIGHHAARDGTPALHVFTGSVAELPAGHAYDKFGAFARLYHQGDTAAAIRALAATGRFGRLKRLAAKAGTNGRKTETNGAIHETNGHVAAPAQPKATVRAVPRFNPFPIELLPPAVRRLCQQGSLAFGCDTSVVALPALVTLSAAIGSSRYLQLKPGWLEPVYIWGAIVAPSGAKKSPAFKLAAEDPGEDLNDEFANSHRRDMEDHEREEFEWELRKKRDKKEGTDTAGEKPKPPSKRLFRVSNITLEAVLETLHDNPRGVLVAKDELDGWFGSFTKYRDKNAGSDQPEWLTLSVAGNINYARKTGNRRQIRVRGAGVAVCGTIQPGILRPALASDKMESGLMARLLLAMPKFPARRWSENGVGAEAYIEYVTLLQRLSEPAAAKIVRGKPTTGIVKMEPAALRVYIDFYNRNGEEMDMAEQAEAAARAKIEGYAARFALIMYCCRTIGSEAEDILLSESDMRAGVALAEWFADEILRVYTLLGERSEDYQVRQLLDQVTELAKRLGKPGVTARDLQRAKRTRFPTAGDAENALQQLVTFGLGKFDTCDTRGRQTTVFTPFCHTSENCVTEVADDDDDATQLAATGSDDEIPP